MYNGGGLLTSPLYGVMKNMSLIQEIVPVVIDSTIGLCNNGHNITITEPNHPIMKDIPLKFKANTTSWCQGLGFFSENITSLASNEGI